MPTPEELARQNIDALLNACGWLIQDRQQTFEANLKRAWRLRQAILKRAFEGKLG